jgi:hypothetical protein
MLDARGPTTNNTQANTIANLDMRRSLAAGRDDGVIGAQRMRDAPRPVPWSLRYVF